jgi:hypothetical protein
VERLNKSTYKKEIDGVDVYHIILCRKRYQTCVICEDYFEHTGNNIKYCPDCRATENLRRANERYHSKKG